VGPHCEHAESEQSNEITTDGHAAPAQHRSVTNWTIMKRFVTALR
jgi:hypothetical protein